MHMCLKWMSLYQRNSGRSAVIILAFGGIVGLSSSAQALTINPSFDSSITSLSNASIVEAAFKTAAAAYTSAFLNPVTVNISVGWGEVGGTTLPSNSAGASQISLAGFYFYSQLRSALTGSVALPATQSGPSYFAMARAEAKALGFLGASAGSDGSVGFNKSLTYDFNPADGVSPGAYNFVGLAEHEIAEVLGRGSSVTSGGPGFYQLPNDLFRYSAPGVQSYSYTDPTYFSLDGGITNLGWFNNGSAGDRSDWLTGGSGSFPGDVQNAYVNQGATSLSAADIALVGALGYNLTPAALATLTQTIPAAALNFADVPEPSAGIILAGGLIGLSLVRRRCVEA